MNQKEINKILSDFKKELTDLLPKKGKDISWAIVCLQDICDWMLFSTDTIKTEETEGIGLSNILKISADSIKLINNKDYDTLLQALAYIKVRLFDISSNAQMARSKFNIIMNRIAPMVPDEKYNWLYDNSKDKKITKHVRKSKDVSKSRVKR